MTKTGSIKSVKYAVTFAAYLFVVWGFYRFLFQLPESLEELLIKPIVWLVPLFIFLRKEKNSLSTIGLTVKNLFPAVYYALGLGLFFVMEAVLVNFIKYQGNFSFNANIGALPLLTSFGLSFATAFSEELSFRGYIFTRIWSAFKSEWAANIVTSIFWAIIHAPITFFVWKLDNLSAVVYLLLTTIFGIGSAFVYAKTKNIFSSILLHVLWQWPIVLFR